MTTKRTLAKAERPPIEEAEEDLSIVYPSSDGEPMAETDYQFTAMTETISSLRQWYRGRDDVYVAGDMLMYYVMNDNETSVAPDIFVVFDASGVHPRSSWFVWREGKAPDFVMELASIGTWRRDAVEKRAIYASMGVTEYWRFDPIGECFTPELVGERLVDGEYQEIRLETDDAGIYRGHSAVLGLDICMLPGRKLRLYDPATGQWLLTPEEEAAARRAAEAARQEAETGRQEAETARYAAEAELQAARDEIEALREQLRRQSGQ